MLRLEIALAGLLLAGAAGCSDGGPKRVPVSGRVTLDGQPVRDMAVNFDPIGTTIGNGAVAGTDADGRFSLIDVRLEAGAYPGEYRVHFYPAAGPSADDGPLAARAAPTKIPALYLSSQMSPVTATVPEGGGSIAIDLTPTGKGVKVVVTPGTP